MAAVPDPTKAPDVINNSWACPPSEGCTDPNVLLAVVQAVRAAGIVTVHSAGNDGWACSTVRDPAAIYAESFSVGATYVTSDNQDNIAAFSSRGPVTIDGSNRRKPDVSAPGVGIRSSYPGGGYTNMSGTSMAGPHVAGAVALLISAYPGLAGKVDQIENILEQSAVHLTSDEGCGGDSATAVPNNVYGWGRIDVLAAFNFVRGVTDVAISRIDATTLQLKWNQVPGATGYEVWHAINAPYFAPGATCAGNPNCTAVAGTTHPEADLGDPVNNHTFVVLSSSRRDASAATPANRTGEFDFGLTPGQ